MAERKHLTFIPTNKGDWQAGLSVHAYDRYNYIDCEFQAEQNGLTTAPGSIVTDAAHPQGYVVANAGWRIVANSKDSALLAEYKAAQSEQKVDQKITEIEQVAGESALNDVSRDFGKYAQLPDVTLEVVFSGKRFNSNGELVDDANWNVGRLGGVERGLLYELYMGGSDKMVLGTALFVSHTIEKVGTQDKDIYTPVFSAMGVRLPIANYTILWAGENYTDLLVSYRVDVAGANVMRVAEWGIFKSVATQYANLKAKVDLKSFADGYYAGMRVGTSDNLTSRGEASAETFVSRIAGGDNQIEDGDARIVRVKGNTLVWNQLFKLVGPSSVTNTANVTIYYNNCHIKITGTPNQTTTFGIFDTSIIIGHKYLCEMNNFVNNSESVYTLIRPYFGSYYNRADGIIAEATKSSFFFGVTTQTGIAVSFEFDTILVDLTQMFGAGNEPTTYEEFLQRKPKVADEYAYNDGELVNMTAEGVRTTGRNLWDEEWESGSIGDNGELVPSTNSIRSKNKINVYGRKVYCVAYTRTSSSLLRIYFYDSNDSLLSVSSWLFPSETFSTPQNCAYVRFRLASAYGMTYKNDICINLSDPSFNGQYEPYETHERKWTETIRKCFPDGMKSAGDVFDEFTPTKATARIAKADLSNVVYSKYSTTIVIANGVAGANKGSAKIISSLSGIVNWANVELPNLTLEFRIGDFGVSTQDELIAKLRQEISNGAEVYYELAEPIVTEYDELNLSERVSVGGLEEAIVPEGVESAPLRADIIYPIDAYNTIKSNKERIETLEQKPAISLTADEVTKLRALISTATQMEGGEV